MADIDASRVTARAANTRKKEEREMAMVEIHGNIIMELQYIIDLHKRNGEYIAEPVERLINLIFHRITLASMHPTSGDRRLLRMLDLESSDPEHQIDRRIPGPYNPELERDYDWIIEHMDDEGCEEQDQDDEQGERDGER